MELCDEYLKKYIMLYPPINDSVHYPEFLQERYRLPDMYTDEFIEKEHNLIESYLKKLKKKKHLTKYDKILKEDLLLLSATFSYELLPLTLNHNIYSNYIGLSSGTQSYQFSDKKSYDDFIHRLSQFPKITNTILSRLKEGLKKQVTHPKLTMVQVINNFNQIIRNKEYSHPRKSLHKRRLMIAIDKYIISSMKRIVTFLTNEYLPLCTNSIGIGKLNGGHKEYLNLVRYNTLKNLHPDTIYEIGIVELKHTLRQLESYKDLPVSKYKFKNGDDIINELKSIQKEIHNDMNNYLMDPLPEHMQYEIKKTPETDKQASAYYVPITKKKKGTFYINIKNPEYWNKKEMYILSLHEGIPGHHYEAWYNFKKDIPMYIKGELYSGYSEGWGLYCESLHTIKDKYVLYFQAKYNILRALRLIIDVGIHYYNWSFSYCFSIMKRYLQWDDGKITNELYRYIEFPGQALSYKIGELVLLKMKHQYIKDGYTLKDFHKKVLEVGPCPLNIFIQEFYK